MADLLALRAMCKFCLQDLQSVGREMQSALAESSAFFGKAELAVAVERELGMGISDHLLETCAAPQDLVLKLSGGCSQVSLADIEAVVRRCLARLLERDVTTADLAMSWKSLLGKS